MVRGKLKVKVGDKVLCSFLGEEIKGVVERVEKSTNNFYKASKKTIWVNDGKYKYPIADIKIKQILDE